MISKTLILMRLLLTVAISCASIADAMAGIFTSGGGLEIVEEGGTIDVGNLANPSTGAVAFSTPVMPGSYSVANINNQQLGHSEGWLGSYPSSTLGQGFVGISLPSIQEISGFAFGRDSNQEYLDDRCLGQYVPYILQYTTAANPDETTPDASWTTIGTLNYIWFTPEHWSEPCAIMSSRHRFSFDPVQATGIRLVVPYTYYESYDPQYGTVIEELELYNTPYVPRGPFLTGSLELVEEGGAFDSGNLAAASTGAVAFSTGEFVNPGYWSYQTREVNDGDYGNDTCWIPQSDCHRNPSFVGIRFDGEKEISSFAFSRDNDLEDTTSPRDRFIGEYTLQYTTVADPDETTPDSEWITIGTLNYNTGGVPNFMDPIIRHRYYFDPVTATAIRLWVPATVGYPYDDNSVSMKAGTAIDEIEVYGPESGVLHPGDANVDGYVDDMDASILAENWLANNANWGMGDFNHDGVVNDKDATLLAANWQPNVAESVPEPASIIMLSAFLLFLPLFYLRRKV